MKDSALSPRAAVTIGLIFMALGALPILAAMRVIHLPLSSGVPRWVGVAAGLTFVLGGAMVIVGYAIAGVEIAFSRRGPAFPLEGGVGGNAVHIIKQRGAEPR